MATEEALAVLEKARTIVAGPLWTKGRVGWFSTGNGLETTTARSASHLITLLEELGNPPGGVCAAGALALADVSLGSFEPARSVLDEILTAGVAVGGYTEGDFSHGLALCMLKATGVNVDCSCGPSLEAYNDQPDRSQQDMLVLFDAAIALTQIRLENPGIEDVLPTPEPKGLLATIETLPFVVTNEMWEHYTQLDVYATAYGPLTVSVAPLTMSAIMAKELNIEVMKFETVDHVPKLDELDWDQAPKGLDDRELVSV